MPNRPSYTTDPLTFQQYQTQPMQFQVGRPNYTMPPMQVDIGQPNVGGGIPAAEQGTVPVGAVDARPGTRLYEIAQRSRGQPQAKRPKQEDILASLLSKAVTGNATPGEGMVPFGELPGTLRKTAAGIYGQPVVGFDPTKLSGPERTMLERLRMMGRKEVQQRVDAQPPRQGPYAGMPGQGGVM